MAANRAKAVLAGLEAMTMAEVEALDMAQLRKLCGLLFHWHQLADAEMGRRAEKPRSK